MLKNFILILLIIAVIGCSNSQKSIEKPIVGKIISVKKIKERDIKPKEGTIVGAGSGAGIGAIIGAIVGTTAGVASAVGTFGLAAPLIPAFTAAGAATGAGMGALTGGASGYVYDYNKAGSGLYEYKILSLNNEIIIVYQIDKEPFKEGDLGQIKWKNNQQVLIKVKDSYN